MNAQIEMTEMNCADIQRFCVRQADKYLSRHEQTNSSADGLKGTWYMRRALEALNL